MSLRLIIFIIMSASIIIVRGISAYTNSGYTFIYAIPDVLKSVISSLIIIGITYLIFM